MNLKYHCPNCAQETSNIQRCTSCGEPISGFVRVIWGQIECPSPMCSNIHDLELKIDSGGTLVHCPNCGKTLPFVP